MPPCRRGMWIPPRTEAALVGMGYEVRRSPLSFAFAGVHGLTMWPDGVEGGADPQRDGIAVGVNQAQVL